MFLINFDGKWPRLSFYLVVLTKFSQLPGSTNHFPKVKSFKNENPPNDNSLIYVCIEIPSHSNDRHPAQQPQRFRTNCRIYALYKDQKG